MFTYKVFCDNIPVMNNKQRLKQLFDEYCLTNNPELLKMIKIHCDIPLSIRIPTRVVMETAVRKIKSPDIDIPEDRIERNDIEDLRDIIGVDLEDLFKI